MGIGLGAAIIASSLIGASASAIMGSQQSKAQKEAMEKQARAQEQAAQMQAKAAQRQRSLAEQNANKAAAAKANAQSIFDNLDTSPEFGRLTGSLGIDPSDLQLGGSSLLGAGFGSSLGGRNGKR